MSIEMQVTGPSSNWPSLSAMKPNYEKDPLWKTAAKVILCTSLLIPLIGTIFDTCYRIYKWCTKPKAKIIQPQQPTTKLNDDRPLYKKIAVATIPRFTILANMLSIISGSLFEKCMIVGFTFGIIEGVIAGINRSSTTPLI